MKTLNLWFPQWQGCKGGERMYEGARTMKSGVFPATHFTEIRVDPAATSPTENGIHNRTLLLKYAGEARAVIERSKPDRIFVLGGDCSVELMPVSYLNEAHGDRLAVIWLDAHGDSNTPQTSTSSNFHGMPLRTLLGDGDPDFINLLFKPLTPRQVYLLGVRDLDNPEKQFFDLKRIRQYGVAALRDSLESLIQTMKKDGFTSVYIHLDLDVIDPREFPSVQCPTPGGLSLKFVDKIHQTLRENFDVVGSSLLEVTNPTDNCIKKLSAFKDNVSFG